MIVLIDRPACLPLLGFLIGCALAVHYESVGANIGETTRAADSLLRHGVIGNPFLLPTGPTAHVSPIEAAVLASVFALFGAVTPASFIVLGIWSAVIFSLGVWVAREAAIEAVPTTPRLASRLAAALLILSLFLEYYVVTTCRVWEQPLSALVLAAGWLVFIRHGHKPDGRSIPAMAALTGVAFLLTASIMPSLLLALLAMLWADRARSGQAARVAVAVAIVAMIALPWGLRNRAELGSFILTRSNAGLELALGNQPHARGMSSAGWDLPLHPSVSLSAAREVQRDGEVAYNKRMAGLARNWIEADPLRFVRLTATRVFLSIAPAPGTAPWFPLLGTGGAAVLLWFLAAAKVAALTASFVLRVRRAECLIFTLLPLTAYWVTHIYLRYQMLTLFTTITMIAILATKGIARLRSGLSSGLRPVQAGI